MEITGDMDLNSITYKQICTLTDIQLSNILLSLMRNEATMLNFKTVRSLIVPLRINVADAGEDGKLDCESVNGSRFIHNPLSIFQCKATKMEKPQVFNEFFAVYKKSKTKGGSPAQIEFKEAIKNVLDEGGQYVFFISYDYNTKSKNLRLSEAYRALDEYNSFHGTEYTHAQVRIMEGNEIANWVNEYLDIVIKVLEHNNIHRVYGLQSIEQLGNLPDINQFAFHSNEVLESYISRIKAVLSSPRSTLRIIGHSGLGKTRLVYEAFKRSENNSAIYYSIVSYPQDIINFVQTYGTYYRGTLIVDNCDQNAHRLLKQQIERTNSTFKLISIDFNVREQTDPADSYGEEYIFLNKRDYVDIVKKILNDQYEHKLDMAQIDQIAEYAEGFPGMAVLFANARLDGQENLSELLRDDTIYKIAFGRDEHNQEKYDLLKAFSIFSSFFKPASGTEDLLTTNEIQLEIDQRKFIIEYICQPAKTQREYLESTEYFERSQVMERRGNFLMVKPTPLAIKLAMEWWKFTDAKQLVDLFPELERIGLAIPLVSRLAELDQLSHAKRIVNQVWGPESPFGTAEVLNTPLGSRIFRSIAHVNPESALQTLQNTFGNQSIVDLKANVGPGRRNIIWSLETLVFPADLFESAAELLVKFAAAENEHIANNATGQFLHLFQIVLPGTGADLKQRLAFIDKLLINPEPVYKEFAYKAMGRGLKGDTFHRDIGAENRGSGAPLKDFYPTWAQSADYWNGIVERLAAVAKADEARRIPIKSMFAGAIRTWFADRMPWLVEKAILSILEFDNTFWDAAISQIKAAIEYEHLGEEDIEVTEKLLAKLKPVGLENELKFYVSTPVWNFEERNRGEYIDHTGIAAENFAERIVKENLDITPIISQMQTGEQRKSYSFGRKLGELMNSVPFAEKLLAVLAEIPADKQNPEILAAYISSLKENDRYGIYHKILENSPTVQHSFYFARIISLPYDEILKLFAVVEAGNVEINSFYQFTYGRGLGMLDTDQVKNLFEKISDYPDGDILALELSNEYIGKDESRWSLFKCFLSDLVMNKNLMTKRNKQNSHYAWCQVVTKLLDERGEAAFTAILIQQLLEAVRADHVGSLDGYLTQIVRRLITSDFETFWKTIGPSLLDRDYFNLRFFMGSHNGNMGTPGLLDTANIETVIEWCSKSQPLGLLRIARMMPITPIGNTQAWHPLAKAMIDQFGDSTDFLEEIGANINSFGSVGSRVPYFQNQLILVSKLVGHSTEQVSKWAKAFVKRKEVDIKRTVIEEQGHYVNF